MNTTQTVARAKPATKAGFLSSLASMLVAWHAERSTMSAVEQLDPHLLRDIGFDVAPGADTVRRRLLIG